METKNIIDVSVLKNHSLKLIFNDGTTKVIDFRPFIKKGVSSALNDISYFEKVQLVEGFICWENGFDFCPNFLYNYDPDAQHLVI